MKRISQYTGWVIPAALLVILAVTGGVSWGATPQAAAGSSHTIFLHSDGTLWGAGQNAFGQLGDGTLRDHDAPARIGTGSSWTAIAAGLEHNLALRADGTLWSWGTSDFGQLGIELPNGSPVPGQLAPVQIGTERNWVAVAAAGGASSFALKADGTLWSWGDNTSGQLGNGDASGSQVNHPVQVANSSGIPFVAIASGAGHALALKADGSLWSWGSNGNGELGLRDTLAQPGFVLSPATPAQVLVDSADSDEDWTAVAAGDAHSLALKADGTLWSWGSNSRGQLGQPGLGTTVDQPIPTRVGSDRDWSRISAGSLNSLAVKRDGTLWSIGDNGHGQLGSGQSVLLSTSAVPTFPAFADFVALSSGVFHGVALQSNGEIYAFGDNSAGQFGSGTRANSTSLVAAGSDALGWVGSEPGGQFTIARRSNGTLWNWGDNFTGQLGDGSSTARLTPGLTGSATNWSAQSAGLSHAVALRSDGTLWSWGDNSRGQLGDNTGNPSLVPIQITTPGSNGWAALAAGDDHTLGLRGDGTLWAWGDNDSGQLGVGSNVQGDQPQQVLIPGGTGNSDNIWVAIAAGASHSIGLQSDGSLWVWGDNSLGQLGDPAFGAGINFPIQLANPAFNNDSSWKAVAAGQGHTLGLQADGTLWAWGDNSDGQLGNLGAALATGQPPAPVLNGSAAPYVAVAAGDKHAAARRADGTLWSWGDDLAGQLGNGPSPGSGATPVQEAGLSSDWALVSAAGSHSVALKAAGTLWSWGDNSSGQLGNATAADRNAPTQLVEAFAQVAASLDFGSLAVSGSAATRPLGLASPGNGSLSITALSIAGADAALFSVSLGTCGGTLPATVPAQGSCQLQVTFTPSAAIGGKAATLSINSNDPLQPQTQVNLSAQLAALLTVTTSVTPVGAGTVTGPLQVVPGSSPAYVVTAHSGYHVTDLKLGGISQGAATSLTLAAISAGTTIDAVFALNPHTVTLSAGAHGSITGPTAVTQNDTPSYTITPALGSFITGVTVDGVPRTVTPSGMTVILAPITADVNVAATFDLFTFTVAATGDAKGSIFPAGSPLIPFGANQSYTFIANTGYQVVRVVADGVDQGALSTYTFNNVTANGHTLKVVFTPDGDLTQDRVTDVADAMRALRIAVKLDTASDADKRHGDVAPVNGAGVPVPDGQITVADALGILRKVVGLTSAF